MKPLIYYNPQCGTSRNTLAMVEASGEAPEAIEYLRTPPTRERLVELLVMMGMTPRGLLRRKGTACDELNLDDPTLTDQQMIDAMMAHPTLINRPIVVTDKSARLCRPSERVLDFLANPVTTVTKDNGEVVRYTEAK